MLAPNAKIRSQVVPKKKEEPDPKSETPKSKRISWAKLLKRVFSIDMENCTQCGGKLELVAAIMETKAVEKILKHVGRPYKPPDIAPAQYPDQLPLF